MSNLTLTEAEMDQYGWRVEGMAGRMYSRAAVEAILRDRLADLQESNVALLQRVADLTTERDTARAEAADTIGGRRVAALHESYGSQIAAAFQAEGEALARAEAAERARDEVIARVQTSLDLLAEMHAKNADIRFGANVVIERVRADLAALAVPAPQPDEGCVPCRVCGGSQTRGWHQHDTTPPTTDAEEARLYVPLTGNWWEPTDDVDWYQTVESCDDDCHHPVHALGHPERLRHLESATWIRANAGSPPGT